MSHDDESIVGINVTPLVDITLVLLIVFMVTAKLVATQAVPFDLPKAATGSETQVVFTVTVDPAGHVEANGRPMTDDTALRLAAREALDRDADVRSVVQAAAGVSHGTVIHVLDELREAGVSRVAFGVDPAAAGAAR